MQSWYPLNLRLRGAFARHIVEAVSSGHNSLPELMITKLYDAIWRHRATMSYNIIPVENRCLFIITINVVNLDIVLADNVLHLAN